MTVPRSAPIQHQDLKSIPAPLCSSAHLLGFFFSLWQFVTAPSARRREAHAKDSRLSVALLPAGSIEFILSCHPHPSSSPAPSLLSCCESGWQLLLLQSLAAICVQLKTRRRLLLLLRWPSRWRLGNYGLLTVDCELVTVDW